jgi:hypothetical protein
MHVHFEDLGKIHWAPVRVHFPALVMEEDVVGRPSMSWLSLIALIDIKATNIAPYSRAA